MAVDPTLTPGSDFDLGIEALATPIALTKADGTIARANPALGHWLGIGLRRLHALPLSALEADGHRLADALQPAQHPVSGATDPLRLQRVALAYPGAMPRFADLWLSARSAGGWLLEVHPVDEFPGDDPLLALPSALSAALKGMAHELRNPLAGLKGAAQLLARRIDARPGDGGDSHELIGMIESEIERLTDLLDRMLFPQPPRVHEQLNIHSVLERVLRLAQTDAGWSVRLVRDYDPSLPVLPGDGDRLVQAAWNLVRNALQAGAVTVTLRTRAEHGVRIGDTLHPLAVRLEIADDGRGVPEALAGQVFLPLVSGRAEGSGLGLALAQQVAREHRGALSYRSRAGRTVFTLLLPAPAPELELDLDLELELDEAEPAAAAPGDVQADD